MADEDWAAEVDEQERQISGQVSEGFDQKWAKSAAKVDIALKHVGISSQNGGVDSLLQS